jgi:GntR family transcriptional repressor for pyruvate dehydrogenase complex
MNAVSFETACEARYALERSCAPLSAKRRSADHLATMRAEIHRQSQPGLTDEAFCASDVAFHRALVDGAQNPVLSYQLAGAVEAMQPLMNMITFSARDRAKIIELHTQLADALDAHDAGGADAALAELESYTTNLAVSVMEKRSSKA